MDKLTVYGNTFQGARLQEIGSFLGSLAASRHEVEIESSFARYLRDAGVSVPAALLPVETPSPDSSLAITLGGDGTLLQAAVWSRHHPLSLLGVNTGHLGFLTAYTLGESHSLLPDLEEGTLVAEHRMMLHLSGEGVPDNVWHYAINEIAIMKADTSSMINVRATVGGFFLADYLADGLIVSTPTGSTGYNLSVGGPIIAPDMHCITLSPVAPHTLTLRPLVVGDNEPLQLITSSRAQMCRVSLDGRSFTMDCDKSLTIHRADRDIVIMRRAGNDFFTTLRRKLSWGSR